ncbi:very short patch repair endonuclease [Knoellia locipacati]|uniref:very short patch repair endonuclease n=1 Tax=Knoellia locipacati TaxID=882824 RepID=UPI00384AD719
MTGRPQASSESVRARLSAQAVRDTKPELALRRELHKRGLRYRVNFPVPGLPRRTIDIAFTRQKVAVFVDGCFWHGCPDHSVPAKANAEWWVAKLQANVERDLGTSQFLENQGWRVLRLWEHDLRDEVSTAAQGGRVVDLWSNRLEAPRGAATDSPGRPPRGRDSRPTA